MQRINNYETNTHGYYSSSPTAFLETSRCFPNNPSYTQHFGIVLLEVHFICFKHNGSRDNFNGAHIIAQITALLFSITSTIPLQRMVELLLLTALSSLTHPGIVLPNRVSNPFVSISFGKLPTVGCTKYCMKSSRHTQNSPLSSIAFLSARGCSSFSH